MAGSQGGASVSPVTYLRVFDRGLGDANLDFTRRNSNTITRSQPINARLRVASSLRGLLKRARKTTGLLSTPSFVPCNKIMEIISPENIGKLLGELTSCGQMTAGERMKIASEVCSVTVGSPFCCRRLVATLIEDEREDWILDILNVELRDDCLLNLALELQQGTGWSEPPCKLFRILGISDEIDKDNFYASANRFTAPYFTRPDRGVNHYIFDLSTILPFMEQLQPASRAEDADDPNDTVGGQGGFGTVRRTRIHPDHHSFSDYGVWENILDHSLTTFTNKNPDFDRGWLCRD